MRMSGRSAVAAIALLIVTGAMTVAGPAPAVAENNGLSLTPAMGWSTWSFIRSHPTEAAVKAQADAMKNSGLINHGFVYINLDDFWMACNSTGPTVDGNGRWVVDTTKFPDGIASLATYVHNDGLKFGLYVTPGIPQNAVTANTPILGTSYHAADIAETGVAEKNYNCQHMYGIDYTKPGAQPYINSWADEFASWGVDYLKIDGVGTSDVGDIQAWSNALRQSGRPINLALSNSLAIGSASTWQQYANSWRTQGDIECYCGTGGASYPLTDWSHVSGRFNAAASWQPYAGSGGWNDYDSLEIGNGTNDGLTTDQRRTTFTLWSMAASPLLLGTDLTHLDATDLAMLDNDSLIGVDQDGVAASRIVNNSSSQVWSKKESSGAYVVALFNTSTTASQTVSVTWSQVGITTSSANVTDLWANTNSGSIATSYSATLRPGEARLIRAVPTSGALTRSVQAEANGNTLSGAAVRATCSTCSGGGKVRFIGNNATNFATINNVVSSATGSHTLTITYELDGSRTFNISVNGGTAIAVPVTGTSWSAPASASITITLTAGSNSITFSNSATYAPDLDAIAIS